MTLTELRDNLWASAELLNEQANQINALLAQTDGISKLLGLFGPTNGKVAPAPASVSAPVSAPAVRKRTSLVEFSMTDMSARKAYMRADADTFSADHWTLQERANFAAKWDVSTAAVAQLLRYMGVPRASVIAHKQRDNEANNG